MMAKASAPGRTKTRLVPPLTFEQAAALNTAFLQDMAANLLSAGSYAAIAGYVAFAPAGTEPFFHDTLPSDIGLIDACLPSLGDCLVHTITEIFARGHAAAVVLNSDSPTLPTALLVETASMLAKPGERAVLGPCTDGGYYLLGLKTLHRRLFEDIAWGTERVAAQTLERAREVKLDVHLLPPWYDVDDVAGLRRLHGELGSACAGLAGLDPHTPYYPAATATLMPSLAAAALIGDRPADVPQIPLGSG
jgi:rSAM/selenodomain-associated transferase 1